MSHFGLEELLVVLSLVFGAGDHAQKSIPEGLPDVATILPGSIEGHVRFSLSPFFRNGNQWVIARIFREPEVQAFLAPLFQQIVEARPKSKKMCEDYLGLTVEELGSLLHMEVSLNYGGLFHPVDTTGQPLRAARPLHDVIVTARLKGNQALLAKSQDRLLGLITSLGKAEVRSHTIEGEPCQLLILPDRDLPEVLSVLLDGHWLAGTNAKTVAAMVRRIKSGPDGNSLADTPTYKASAGRTLRSGSFFAAYACPSRLLKTFDSEFSNSDRRGFAEFGLTSLEAVAIGMDLDGPGIRERLYLHVPAPQGIFSILQGKDDRIDAERLLPVDSVLAGATRIPFGATFDWIHSFLGTISSRERNAMDEEIAALDQNMGMSLRRDLLANLGSEVAYYASMEGQSLIPNFALVLQVKDRAKVQAYVEKIFEMAGPESLRRKFLFLGETIEILDGSSLPMGRPWLTLSPSWAFASDRLVIALWPEVVKNFLRSAKQKKSAGLDANSDYASLHGRFRAEEPRAGSTMLFYADLRRLAGFVLDNGLPALQSLGHLHHHIPLDFALFPSTSVVTQHLFGAAAHGTTTESGHLYEMYSPMGFVAPMVLVAGAMATAVQVRSNTMETYPDAAAAPDLIEVAPTSNLDSAVTQSDALKNAVEQFRLHEMSVPDDAKWPDFLLSGSKNHAAPYVDASAFQWRDGAPLDPWGNPWRFTKDSARSYQIKSFGPDGVEGNDDIVIQ